MHLVQRAVDAHGGFESRHSLVLLQPQQDAGQGSSYQVGGAMRDDGTNLKDQNQRKQKAHVVAECMCKKSLK